MDEIIDFNELKNKAKDKDVDKFEQYIYSLYYSLAQGEINMGELSRRIIEYMEDNNISQEKFMNIQKKLMERYGISSEDIELQMKNLGIELPAMGEMADYEKMRKSLSFQEKYDKKIQMKPMTFYVIKNSINDLEIFMSDDKIIIKSFKEIDLRDNELNEFLCSYKKLIEDKALNIELCENIKSYNY